VLEEPREITGARYAALGIPDRDRRELERFITRGIDADAHRAIGDLPRGRGILGVLIDSPRPVRIADVGARPKSYGFRRDIHRRRVRDAVRAPGRPAPGVGRVHPRQALAPRLLVLVAAAGLVLVVSLAVTALSFTPHTLWAFAAGTLLVGITYGLLGALAGAAVGRLGATHLMLFGTMLDLGIAQNQMFGSGQPPGWAVVLPGYGPGRVIVDGAFSGSFVGGGELALSIAWVLVLGVAVSVVLGRLVAVEDRG